MSAPFPGTHWHTEQDSDNWPKNAILAGEGPSGKVFVGGIQHLQEFTPTKIVPLRKKAYYPADGKEHSTGTMMYLVIEDGYKYKWKNYNVDNPIPKNACRIGHRNDGNPYYVGKVDMNGHPVVAKINAHSKTCRAPMSGAVHSHHDCEILIIKKKD